MVPDQTTCLVAVDAKDIHFMDYAKYMRPTFIVTQINFGMECTGSKREATEWYFE